MKADRVKLTSPEAFMVAFSRYESNNNFGKDNTSNKDEEWNQALKLP